MAKVFRGMFAAADGRPSVANDKNSLGVTTPAERPTSASDKWVPDVVPDGGGQVMPGQGMSVAPAAADLPAHRIPKRLRDRGFPDAKGGDKLRLWSCGSGPFEVSVVAVGLTLRPDTVDHGVIEPAERMPLDVYRRHLASTVADWSIDEP